MPSGSIETARCWPRRPSGDRNCGGASGTAFFGEGLVAPDFGSFTWDGLLPGGGVGLRFTVATQNHVNLRVDYAWGKNSSALYMGVAEAF